MVARMPEAMCEKTIADLRIGEGTWALPWAMLVDNDRCCWLQPEFAQNSRPGGTTEMRIERTKEGFVVDISRCGYHRWHKDSPSPNCLPIVKLNGIGRMNDDDDSDR
jgi:hypothetical protein